ncbi:hypothetical protein GBAR_LOCUS26148 [Geodia barretti]|uniref:Uncharacterized protein n=1 Tax=Geodia barretti TaxID=519541 RepID=A0AA35TGT6_GEOBA|nr:hypothetical protein GBAR_LOCUS26148 [Geodia barretti]
MLVEAGFRERCAVGSDEGQRVRACRAANAGSHFQVAAFQADALGPGDGGAFQRLNGHCHQHGLGNALHQQGTQQRLLPPLKRLAPKGRAQAGESVVFSRLAEGGAEIEALGDPPIDLICAHVRL